MEILLKYLSIVVQLLEGFNNACISARPDYLLTRIRQCSLVIFLFVDNFVLLYSFTLGIYNKTVNGKGKFTAITTQCMGIDKQTSELTERPPVPAQRCAEKKNLS
jgi:hypothetical protein